MTIEDKLIKIATWKTDIIQFLKDCFPHHFNKDFAGFHREIYSILRDHARIALAAPRGFVSAPKWWGNKI